MTGDRIMAADLGVEFDANTKAHTERQLNLGFAREGGGRTFLDRQRVAYPFHVCRALHVPGDPEAICTVYMQSCSGGIFQHDRLGLHIRLAPDAQAHLTTAASTVVHMMHEGHAEQEVLLDVGDGAIAEYLPDPMIMFPTSRLKSSVTVRAHENATVVVQDAFLLHDPQGKAQSFEWLQSTTRIEDDHGKLLALDRFRVEGPTIYANQPGINDRYGLQATLMVVHRRDPAGVLRALRVALPEASEDAFVGASLMPNDAGVWLRVLATNAVSLRNVLRTAWESTRAFVTGAPPGVRRK